MKRLFLLLLLGLAAALALGSWILRDPGYVLVIRDHWELETSLGFTVLVLLLLALLLVATTLTLASLWNLLAPSRLTARWRQRSADQRLKSGLHALLEGQWKKAEKQLLVTARRGDWPLPAWLGAALAAEMAEQRARARDHLAQAAACPRGDLPAGLLLARMAGSEGALARARAELEKLRAGYPTNPLVLHQLAEIYERSEAWQPLADLLPVMQRLERNRVALPLRERRVWQGLLRDCGRDTKGDPEQRLAQLRALWRQVPGPLRNDPTLVAMQAESLARHGAGNEALKLIHRQLHTAWDDRLPSVLEHIQDLPPEKLLAQLETWLADHPGNRRLLVSAGRVALRARLWGKARAFFEAAGDDSTALAELARLHRALGDHARVQACLDKQLKLMGATLPDLPMPDSRDE